MNFKQKFTGKAFNPLVAFFYDETFLQVSNVSKRFDLIYKALRLGILENILPGIRGIENGNECLE